MAIVGPLLTEWLKHWLESILHKAAARLEGRAFGDAAAARAALFDEAIALAPRFAFARRALLRHLRDAGDGPDPEAVRDLAAAAENE